MLSSLLANTVYIKIHPNRFELKHIETGKILILTSPQAFTTRRLLVGQYKVAEDLLRKGIKKLHDGKLFAASPRVVVHPMSMVEDGLSEIEERALHELAMGAGARKVKLWVGHTLSDAEVVRHAAQE